MQKHDEWNEVKKLTSTKSRKLGIKPREVFWVKIGHNIGDEEYGKGEIFSRPVLVIRQLTHDLFIGIPITSTLKDDDYFHTFTYSSKKGLLQNSAMVLQLRTFSKKRVTDKIGKMSIEDFKKVQEKIVKMIIPT